MAAFDAPDIGTLGGTFQDSDGESSATLGGALTPNQSWANEGVNNDSWGYDFSSAGFLDPSAFSLGNFFGYNAGSGLPTSSGTYTSNADSFGLKDLWNSRGGKLARGLIGMTPAGGVINTLGNLATGDYGGALRGALGGPLGAVAGMGVDAAQGKNVLGSMSGMGGSMVGSGLLGPMGAQLGGYVGNTFGDALANRGGTPGINPNEQGTGMFNNFGVGDAIQGLGTLYQMSQADKGAREAQAAMSGGSGGTDLNALFGPNSAASQQMRKELERRDAASGRRSQYGPREVELQAALAKLQASAAPGIQNANANSARQLFEMNQLKNQRRQQGLNSLFGIAKNTGILNNIGGMFRQAPSIGSDISPISMGDYSLTGMGGVTGSGSSFGGDTNFWWTE